jgi:hypothetical protein
MHHGSYFTSTGFKLLLIPEGENNVVIFERSVIYLRHILTIK